MGAESRPGCRRGQDRGRDLTPKQYLARIHELHCVICKFCFGKYRPATEAHHLESYRGDHSDFATIPMCKDCHTLLHKIHRRAFYSGHNVDDVKLLAWTIKLLMEEE